MKVMKVKATGVAPILFHNIELVDKSNQTVIEMAEITSKKRNKTTEDEVRLSFLEFKGGMYYNEKLGPVIPALVLEGSIIKGASSIRKGKNAKAGLRCIKDFYKLDYDGPRTFKELYEKKFYDLRAVVVQRARIMRTRPRFNDWSVEFDLTYDDSIIGEQDVISSLNAAGTKEGFGDFRPRFGRFTVDILS